MCLNINIVMTVKTITITQNAYEAIKSMKHEEESFSDLFLRIGRKPLTIKDLAGILKHTPAEAEAFKRRVLEARERLNKSMQEHTEDARTRLKRDH